MDKRVKKSLKSCFFFILCLSLAACRPKEGKKEVVELPSDAFNQEILDSNTDEPAEAEVSEEVRDTPGITLIAGNDDEQEASGAESERESASGKGSEGKAGDEPVLPAAGVLGDEMAKQSFYQEVLSQELRDKMMGVSYPAEGSEQLSLDELRYIHVLHYDFEGNVKEGEIVCNKSISDDLLDIFYELYLQKYPITSMKLIDEFGGDDTLSMEANNTSAFNYRVVSGTDRLSKHALGVAIDINPQINPYVVLKDGEIVRVSPENGTDYADRTKEFPGKIDKNDLCYKLFHERGFFWGGDWKNTKDYQHFQKTES